MTTPEIQEIECNVPQHGESWPTKRAESSSPPTSSPQKRKLDVPTKAEPTGGDRVAHSGQGDDEVHNKRSVVQISMDGKEYRDPVFYFHTKEALLLKNLFDSWRKPGVMKNVQVKVFYPEEDGQEANSQANQDDQQSDHQANQSSQAKPIMRWISMDPNRIQILNATVFSHVWAEAYLKNGQDGDQSELKFIVDTKELFEKSALADVSNAKQELHWLMTADREHVLFVPKYDGEQPSHSSTHRFSEDLYDLLGKGSGNSGGSSSGGGGGGANKDGNSQSQDDLDDAIIDLQAVLPRLRIPRYTHKMRAKTLLECIKSLKKCRTDDNLLSVLILEDRLQLICNKKIQTLMKSHPQEWIFGMAAPSVSATAATTATTETAGPSDQPMQEDVEGQVKSEVAASPGHDKGVKSFKMNFNIVFLEECTKILECSVQAQIKLSFMEMQVGDHVLMIEQVIENQHLGLKREGQDDDAPLAANLVVLATKHTDDTTGTA